MLGAKIDLQWMNRKIKTLMNKKKRNLGSCSQQYPRVAVF